GRHGVRVARVLLGRRGGTFSGCNRKTESWLRRARQTREGTRYNLSRFPTNIQRALRREMPEQVSAPKWQVTGDAAGEDMACRIGGESRLAERGIPESGVQAHAGRGPADNPPVGWRLAARSRTDARNRLWHRANQAQIHLSEDRRAPTD